MKKISLFAIFCFFLSVTSACFATTYYRHIPFTVTLKPGDNLVVNYNFSGKFGIKCSASQNNTWVNFLFKGSEKQSPLPVTLQNAHIPQHKQEKLADIEGQFSISSHARGDIMTHFQVSCGYVS